MNSISNPQSGVDYSMLTEQLNQQKSAIARSCEFDVHFGDSECGIFVVSGIAIYALSMIAGMFLLPMASLATVVAITVGGLAAGALLPVTLAIGLIFVTCLIRKKILSAPVNQLLAEVKKYSGEVKDRAHLQAAKDILTCTFGNTYHHINRYTILQNAMSFEQKEILGLVKFSRNEKYGSNGFCESLI